jgi:predicted AAA+ superfamily ATPase
MANPSAFLNQKEQGALLAIEEAERAPELFETIKEVVDLDRRPCQFILLGSTEFSHRTNIRESLTGRASRAQIYPFNLAETHDEPPKKGDFIKSLKQPPRFSQKDVLTYLDRGGMPGIFAVRSSAERSNLMEDWIDLSLSRDLFQIKNFRPDALLARRMLEYIATHSENSIKDMTKALSVDRRRIQKHMDALKALFIVNPIEPILESTGEAIYFLCDVGIAKHLGAGFDQRLRTWVALELLSQLSYTGYATGQTLFTYRTEKGSRIDFVMKGQDNRYTAIKVFPFEGVVYQELEILRAFNNKFEAAESFALCSQAANAAGEEGLKLIPWETLG